jgi:ribonucleoside-diphosphate reductase, alpha subunit
MNLRKGSATLYYPVWHLEVEDMLVLKNNKGTENTRARDVDYAVQLNKHFYEKARSKENNDYYLFSPSDVPGLYEAFFADQKAFVELYNQYVADETIRKKKVSAKELFTQICIERMSTGRIYVNNVDIMNINTPFIPEKAPIYSSNLCNEIALPTKPLQTPEKTSEGEIALCTLSAINCYKFYDEQGKLNHVDLEETCTSAVRSLDALLSYQDYPVEQAREAALKRRSLGISTTNLAGLAAKLKLRYESPEFLNKLDEWMEALAYYCLKASNQLAKEKGKAEWLGDTTWQKGVLPQDRANERARSLVTRERTLDWGALRKEIVESGLRNSTLLTQAPIEASSLVTHSTNGIEPPRALLSIKANKDGATKQLVPDYELYKDFYTTMWSLQNNDATLNISAVMQVWIDQAISTNLNYDPAKYPNRQIPVAQMMKDILKAYSLGVKTIYYCNIRDGQKESNVLESMGCDGGACAI